MTDPITPPPELVQEWASTQEYSIAPAWVLNDIATRAAQWGADQELEACIKVIADRDWFANPVHRMAELRAARRPKPPSLVEEALEQLDGIAAAFRVSHGGDLVCDTIRRALERLRQLEDQQ